jgi:hypothetical protein
MRCIVSPKEERAQKTGESEQLLMGHTRGPAAKNERRPAQDLNEWPGHRVTVDRLAKNQTLPSSIIFRIVRTFLLPPPADRYDRLPTAHLHICLCNGQQPVEGKLIYFWVFFFHGHVRAKGAKKGGSSFQLRMFPIQIEMFRRQKVAARWKNQS